MHTPQPTAFGRCSQPHSVRDFGYRIRMAKIDSKKVLWDNVSRLMDKRYGKENLTKLAKDAKMGPGSATRIKNQETSVGTDILDQLAVALEVQTWQLLVPDLDADSLPELNKEWPFELIRLSQFLQLDEKARRDIENAMAGEWMRLEVKNDNQSK